MTEHQALIISEPVEVAARTPTWKHILDVVCIIAAAPFLLPVMTVIALLIKLISPGPVIFRQDRIGYLGRPFKCFKFRTMHVNSAVAQQDQYLKTLIQSEAPMTKKDMIGDPRIFPLAGLLRATGLDELPQIFNVVRGEMSLVGPRPCLPSEYENYLPWQKRRFNTLPGLTGLWQVSGKNKTTFSQMIDLDISYVVNRSLSQDLKIMLKTFPVLFFQCLELLKKRLRRLSR